MIVWDPRGRCRHLTGISEVERREGSVRQLSAEPRAARVDRFKVFILNVNSGEYAHKNFNLRSLTKLHRFLHTSVPTDINLFVT